MDRPVPAAPAKTAPPAAAAPPPKKSKKLLWIVMALLVVLAGAGGAAYWFLKPHKPASAKPLAPAQYIALDPAFVVNLADAESVRYLQADVQLQTRDPETAAAIGMHAPIIRNRLLLLFGQQSSASLGQRSGKERLQEAARDEVRRVLRDEGAPDKVEAVIFTSLVTQ